LFTQSASARALACVISSALVFLQAEDKLVVHGDALSISKGGRRRDQG
jgi:hypothetical protein